MIAAKPATRGSWFDKLTMRESVDGTLIAKLAEYSSLQPTYLRHPMAPISPSSSGFHLSVILGLDPRTHNSKLLNIRIHLIFLTVGPRVKPEDDGDGWIAGSYILQLQHHQIRDQPSPLHIRLKASAIPLPPGPARIWRNRFPCRSVSPLRVRGCR
ncbi:hypothetical protein SAMN05443582_10332 [Phyllobacterium sp. OV277]|nr:hypothetical protein SAMN05443582_10332 [Phyllobacterium sp. OV277]